MSLGALRLRRPLISCLGQMPRGGTWRVVAWLSVGWAMSGVGVTPVAWAAGPQDATSSQEVRDEAIRRIPLAQLAPDVQAKVGRVVSRPSIYRCLPIQTTCCDPQLYMFLVRYPEVVVNMWELMDITKVQIRRTGPWSFRAADGAGTVSQVELVYGSRDLHVYYAEGSYEGPLLKRNITGSCVLVLRSGYIGEPTGSPIVVSRLDVFLQLDNAGAELIAKTLQPVVGRAADVNFAESTAFLGQVSLAAQRNSPGLQRMAARLTHVDPSVRLQFAGLTAQLARRAGWENSPLAQRPVVESAEPTDTETGGENTPGGPLLAPAAPSESGELVEIRSTPPRSADRAVLYEVPGRDGPTFRR